ncbi:ABC transporter permease [Homoserinimonas sp. OAct 916]|uniref:ABC transporter permease n=1 Tax=Homoserinimonas sp. OAct 916 TaxID=2211450 RepID=UPI000DBE2FEF|nr:FtsX-like permease family protein [Homoserinimonas sp. OAct 916]
MRFVDILGAAVSNSFRSKLRTSLTVIAVFIGAFTLTITSAIGTGVNEYITTQVASMGAADVLTVTKQGDQTKNIDAGPAKYDPAKASLSGGFGPGGQAPPGVSFSALTLKDIDTIGATPGILDANPLTQVSPNYIEYNGRGKFELTVDPAAALTTPDLVAGEPFSESGDANEILLPGSYLENLGLGKADAAVGKTVTLGITTYTGEQREVTATVAGVKNESLFSNGVGLSQPLTDALSAIQNQGKPSNTVEGFFAATAHIDANSTQEQIDVIKADLDAQGFKAQTVADQLGTFETVINGIVGVLNAFAVIALIAAGFGIINTLLMSVQERTREIGLMKAMGMSGGKIYALFSMEAIFIGFLGSAIGAVVAIALGSVISNALSNTVLSGLPGLHIMQFAPASIAVIIGIVMLIAFLAGTLPARRAARQNPIDALRYE